MEANELRIGNWILNGIDEEIQANPATIGCFTSSQWILGAFKSIPLTESWLIRFGFEHKTKEETGYEGWYSEMKGGSSIRIFEIENGWFKYSSADNPIKHVHSLQNLIHALTGTELELKPEKA